MRQVPLAVQLITYISDSCSREPFVTEVAEKLCFEHVARGHNPEPKPNTIVSDSLVVRVDGCQPKGPRFDPRRGTEKAP